MDLVSDAEMALVPQLIAAELLNSGYDPVMIYADWNLISMCRNANIDLALNIAEGFEHYNAHEHLVPCLLEYARVPYTGADPTNMLLVRDKILTRRIVQGIGVKAPNFHFVTARILFDLPLSLVETPGREGRNIAQKFDTKSGFRDLFHEWNLDNLGLVMPHGVICQTATEAARETVQRLERGINCLCKADRGESGTGLLWFDTTDAVNMVMSKIN